METGRGGAGCGGLATRPGFKEAGSGLADEPGGAGCGGSVGSGRGSGAGTGGGCGRPGSGTGDGSGPGCGMGSGPGSGDGGGLGSGDGGGARLRRRRRARLRQRGRRGRARYFRRQLRDLRITPAPPGPHRATRCIPARRPAADRTLTGRHSLSVPGCRPRYRASAPPCNWRTWCENRHRHIARRISGTSACSPRQSAGAFLRMPPYSTSSTDSLVPGRSQSA